jgi:hypothetical protein
MGLRDWLGGLLGRGGGGGGGATEGAAADAVAYRDYVITPRPIRQAGGYLTAGTIVKETPEGRREHRFVRADTHSSEEDARRFMVQKAQRLIDEVGDRLFAGGG